MCPETRFFAIFFMCGSLVSYKLHRMIAWNNVELLVELKPAKKNYWPKFGPNRPKLGLKLGFISFSQVLFISFSLNCMG